MDEQPTLPAEVRVSLPPIAQAYVGFLENQIALLRDQVVTLQEMITKLQGQVAEAQAAPASTRATPLARRRAPRVSGALPPLRGPRASPGSDGRSVRSRLTAMGSLLHGRFRLSMRETSDVFADLFGVPLGPGSVSALCQEVNAALAEPYFA